MKCSRLYFCLLLLGFLSLSSCGIYSFTGASIPAGTKTISIGFFKNKAPSVQPTISQLLTDNMKSYFVAQSNLNLVEGIADVEITGDIIGYSVNPSAIQGNDKAALNRLSVTIQVRFVNRINEKLSFSQSFSRFRDYDAKLNLMAVESELIDQICKELVEDVYQKAFVNW
ncbi:MAG: LptE family protein [Bacteroidales bacterium]